MTTCGAPILIPKIATTGKNMRAIIVEGKNVPNTATITFTTAQSIHRSAPLITRNTCWAMIRANPDSRRQNAITLPPATSIRMSQGKFRKSPSFRNPEPKPTATNTRAMIAGDPINTSNSAEKDTSTRKTTQSSKNNQWAGVKGITFFWGTLVRCSPAVAAPWKEDRRRIRAPEIEDRRRAATGSPACGSSRSSSSVSKGFPGFTG
mmetsp:Transcript_26764/g.61173  ORF Transcript_26764/g.61173 Transcript_26764/m.61173 type:complete len:206 (-) Transcript_26764:1505-2122(-)